MIKGKTSIRTVQKVKLNPPKVQVKKVLKTFKKRRFRPGTVVLREVKRYQNSTDNLMRVGSF